MRFDKRLRGRAAWLALACTLVGCRAPGTGGAAGARGPAGGGAAGFAGAAGGAGPATGLAGAGGSSTSVGSGGASVDAGAGSDLGSADAGSNDTAADAGTCLLCSAAPRTLPLPGAQHLLADSQRRRLYVTTGPQDPRYPDSLVVVDPGTLAVVTSVALPTQPNLLALSPDGSRLWIGIDGAYAIRSVDLSTGTPVPGPQYVLPHGANALPDQTVGALAFVNGSAGSLMLTLYAPGNRQYSGVVVLDEGVPRSPPSYVPASRLAAGMGNVVFGYNDQSTAYDFYVFTVGPSGVTYATYGSLVSGFNNQLVYSAADLRVYAYSGSVVNVADPAMPIRTPGFREFGPFALVPGAPRAVRVQTPAFGSGPLTLAQLDTSLFTVLSSAMLAGIREETAWDLCVVATDTVAFLASDASRDPPKELVVIKTGELR